jgi:hypothetical protein
LSTGPKRERSKYFCQKSKKALVRFRLQQLHQENPMQSRDAKRKRKMQQKKPPHFNDGD